MTDHIPHEMRRNGRAVDCIFSDDEPLYIRFKILDEDGRVPMDQIRSTNQSVNRGKYSRPEWVLITENNVLGHFGYGLFHVQDIPCTITKDGSPQYWFRISHSPEEWNYSHSEILAHKGSKTVSPAKKIHHTIKTEFRMWLRDKISVLKPPNPSAATNIL